MSETELDRLLARARANPPQPSDALMARVLADALAAQPVAPAPAVPLPAPPRRGFWRALTAGFGGSAVLAGLGGVAMMGLFFGYADPAGLADRLLITTDSGLELVPVAELFLSEG